jgi:hypothetical protein
MSALIRDNKGQFVIIVALLIAALTLATIISIHSINIHSQSIAYTPANEFLLGITADMNRALTVSLAKYTNEILNLKHTEETAIENGTNFMETWKQSVLTSYSNYGIEIRTDLPQNMNTTFRKDWEHVNGISSSYAYIPYAFDVNSYGFIGWTGTTAKYVQLQINSVNVENWTTGLTQVEFQLMQSDISVNSLRPIPDLPTNPNSAKFRIGSYNGITDEFTPWTGQISLTYLGNGNYRATLSSADPVDPSQAINPIHKGVRIELATPNDEVWIQNSYYLYDKAASTTTTQLSPPSPIIFGQTVTDSANVTGLGEGYPIPSGQIQFQVSTDNITWTAIGMQKTLSNGTANSDTYSPLVGNSTFIAVYFGDDNYDVSQSVLGAEPMVVNNPTPNVTTILSATTITLGGSPNSIIDEATVTNLGPDFPAPTGNVTFQVSQGDVLIWTTFSKVPLGPHGRATSETYTPLAAGSYHFRAVYSGDNYYNSAQSGDLDENLTVNKATPKVITFITPPAIPLGGNVTDSANVMGIGGIFPAPTGSVTFEVRTDSDSSWSAFTPDRPLVDGSATSDLYVTNSSITTYYFRADYSGDSNYESATSGDEDEPLTPGQASITTTLSSPTIQLGNPVSDTATVTGIDSPPTGTVSFEYRKGTSGTWVQLSNETLTPIPSSSTSEANSPSIVLTSAGDWYFRAVYSGDTNYIPSASGDTAEPLTVSKADPTVATLLSAENITLGQSIFDSATVTGLDGIFPAPTGLVTFQVSQDGGLTWAAFGSNKNLTGNSVTSDSYSPNSAEPNIWYFRAFYQGDDNYNNATSGNTAEPLTVDKATTITSTLLSASTITYGQSITDTAKVTGLGTGFPFPTGTVTFEYSTDGGSNWTTFGSPKTLIDGSVISDLYAPFSAGDFNFRAVYLGDNNYLGSFSSFNAEPLYVDMAPGTIGTLIISSYSVSGQSPFISNDPNSPLNPYDKVNPQLSVGSPSITFDSNFQMPSILTANQIDLTFFLQTTMVSHVPYQTIKADLTFTYQSQTYSIGSVTFDAIAGSSNPPPLYYYESIDVTGRTFVPTFPVQAIPAGSTLHLTLTLINPQNRVDAYGGIAGIQIKLF